MELSLVVEFDAGDACTSSRQYQKLLMPTQLLIETEKERGEESETKSSVSSKKTFRECLPSTRFY